MRAHVAMFDWLEGSVAQIVPENLKAGVIKHSAEGDVVRNDAYRELAAHYPAAVLPRRVKKLNGKSSAENTASSVATWVIAVLRNQTFASLPELRAAIYSRVPAINAEPL